MKSRKSRVQEKSSVHFASGLAASEAPEYFPAVPQAVPQGAILAYIIPVSGSMPSPPAPPVMSEDEKWRRCIEALPEYKPDSAESV